MTAKDIIADYGDRSDHVSAFASLAATGSRPQHAHRDLMTWAKTFGSDLTPALVRCTHRKQHEHGTTSSDHWVLYPHEVFAAMYDRKTELWNHSIMGPEGFAGIEEFWSSESGKDWFVRHPALKHDDLRHCIPLGFHADKGAHIKRDKILTISWGSAMSVAPTEWSHFLFTILPDELAASETAEQLYAVLVWSVQWLSLGIWPDTDHNGNPWPHGSRRKRLVGKPLAGPPSLPLCFTPEVP